MIIAKLGAASMNKVESSIYSSKSLHTAALLCYFLGIFGIHRLYLGKYISAIIQFLTIGGIGLWWIYDLMILGKEKFTDKANKRLIWHYKHKDPAGFVLRLLAYSLDLLIINFVIYFFYFILMLDDLTGYDGIFGISLSFIRLFIVLSYFVLFNYFYGATPGKIVFNLEIIDKSNQHISFTQSLVRYIAYFVSYIFLIGFIMICIRKDKRGLHDLISGTKVIYVGYGRSRL
jgi:uncharacterized RDD family membrane protein YckC/TM2 domain-containing membrane protein YozV